jgi:hypothetical protein
MVVARLEEFSKKTKELYRKKSDDSDEENKTEK